MKNIHTSTIYIIRTQQLNEYLIIIKIYLIDEQLK